MSLKKTPWTLPEAMMWMDFISYKILIAALDTGHPAVKYLKEGILTIKKFTAFSGEFFIAEVTTMELSNEFIEDLFFKQMKELTIKSSKRLKSFDAQFSG